MNIDIFKIYQIKEREFEYDTPSLIGNPKDAYQIVTKAFNLQQEAVENLGVITLNTKNAVNGMHIVSRGSLNFSIAHPREIYKLAILNNASSIILFHNHPSGNSKPSREDIKVTNKVADAGRVLGIEVLDHIVVGEGEYTSFKEKGLVI